MTKHYITPEEHARLQRRRGRQALGLLITILVLVGFVTVLRAGVGLVANLFDDTAQKQEYEDKLEGLVLFDPMPFDGIENIDDLTLREAAVWGCIYNIQETQGGFDNYNTDPDTEQLLLPSVEVDAYLARLVGPSFKLTHRSFEMEDMTIEFDESSQCYKIPVTGTVGYYRAVVTRLFKRSGQLHVTVGYIPTSSTDDSIINQSSDTPTKYMDYLFERQSGSWYLTGLTESETKGMFIDILPELPPDDGTARVSFYLDDDDDAEAILKEVDEGLSELRQYVEIGEGTITASETEDKDWINNWKQYFKPFTVDHILIKPTWEEIPEEHKDKLLIQIDPGTAFGTGKHETTQLCIRQLEKYVKPGVRILDLGTGSGILGITALKLGAGSVFGTDLDENAITAVHENLEANGIPEEKFGVVQGNIIDEKEVQDAAGYECYDIAVANILADVIIMIQKEVPVHLKQGGIFITSGIIDMKEQAVRDALSQNDAFEILETTRQGEWVSITARKR